LSSLWKARSRSMLCGSLSQRCILMKGSRPLRLSMCQGLGLDSSSEIVPWESWSTASPKSFWPRLWNCSSSLTREVMSAVSSSCVIAATSKDWDAEGVVVDDVEDEVEEVRGGGGGGRERSVGRGPGGRKAVGGSASTPGEE
jgi:hypothetical protein